MQKIFSSFLILFVLVVTGCQTVPTTSEPPVAIAPSQAELAPPRMDEYEPYTDYEISRDVINGTYLGSVDPEHAKNQRRRALAATDNVVRVAMMLPLSGKASKLGWSMQNAAQLALFQSQNKSVVLQFYDTQGTVDGARRAIEDVMKAYPDVIVGPVFSDNVKMVRSKVKDIPLVSFTTDPTAISSESYSMGLLQPYEVERILGFAIAQQKKRIAVIFPNDVMGRVSYSAAQRAIAEHGGELVDYGFYQPRNFKSIEDTVKQLAKYDDRHEALVEHRKLLEEQIEAGRDVEENKAALKALEHVDTLGDLDFDAVLIVAAGNDLKKIGSFLRYYEIDPSKVQYLGTAIWKQYSVLSDANLLHSWFASTDSRYETAFEESYQKAFEDAKPQALASLSYDSIAMIASLSDEGHFNQSGLTQINGFFGVDGVFRLRPNGQAERGLEIRRITGKGISSVIEYAPKSFKNVLYKSGF